MWLTWFVGTSYLYKLGWECEKSLHEKACMGMFLQEVAQVLEMLLAILVSWYGLLTFFQVIVLLSVWHTWFRGFLLDESSWFSIIQTCSVQYCLFVFMVFCSFTDHMFLRWKHLS